MFAEFDPAIGPVITYQIPETIFTKQRFDTFSAAVITKPELFNRLLKANLNDYKVMGYPVGLDHQKYQRNSYIFNLCFVVENKTHIDSVYEPLVQKCAQYLVQLEQECEFLHNETSKKEQLPKLLLQIFNGLNNDGQCTIRVTPQTTLHLKLSPSFHGKDPASIAPYLVPIFTRLPPPVSPADLPKLDVLSQKICPCIDGFRTVQEMATSVQIDSDLVGRCVRNLQFYGLVTLVPLFLYSNTYVSTDALHNFFQDADAMRDCLEFVKVPARGREEQKGTPTPTAKFSDVFRLYASLRPGLTLKEWCERTNPRSLNVDERKLIQFGLVRGFLRKLAIYPIYNGKESLMKRIDIDCDGSRSLEELSVTYSTSPKDLLKRLVASDRFVFLTK
uniref:Nitrogen permease regulator 2-like protein n=1 Tax=Plectus sambesii TaxID=2011161 RepID=A0A914WVZ2_9BILA